MDQVRLTTESVKTGSGNDTINVADGVKGNVSCGAGTDAVICRHGRHGRKRLRGERAR